MTKTSRSELAPYFNWAKPSVTWDIKYAKKFVENLAAGYFGQEHFKVMYRWEMIGYVGIFPLPYPKQAEIVIWVTTGFDRVGVAKLVTREMIKSQFQVRGYELLQWSHVEDNEASGSVAESCGFTYVGQFRKYYDEDDDQYYFGEVSRWILINPWLKGMTDSLEDPIFTLRNEHEKEPQSQSRQRVDRSMGETTKNHVLTKFSSTQIRNMIDASG